MRNSRAWAGESGINILGLGADEDSKIRKYFHIRCHGAGNKEHGLSLEVPDFTFLAPLEKINNDHYIPELVFPDQLLNTRRLLVMGQKCAMLEHISQVFQNYRLATGLWQTDVWVKDKQNVDVTLRLLHPRVRSCLLNFDDNETVTTRVYLKIGQKMRNAYACNNLTIAERIEAWMPVLFLRLWKQWLKIEKHDVYSNFISDQTCRDMIISGHSLILTVKVFAWYLAAINAKNCLRKYDVLKKSKQM